MLELKIVSTVHISHFYFFIIPTDAHNYKIIGILKQLKFRLSLLHISVHAGTIIREPFRALLKLQLWFYVLVVTDVINVMGAYQPVVQVCSSAHSDTVRLVAQHLSHYATPGRAVKVSEIYIISWTFCVEQLELNEFLVPYFVTLILLTISPFLRKSVDSELNCVFLDLF